MSDNKLIKQSLLTKRNISQMMRFLLGDVCLKVVYIGFDLPSIIILINNASLCFHKLRISTQGAGPLPQSRHVAPVR